MKISWGTGSKWAFLDYVGSRVHCLAPFSQRCSASCSRTLGQDFVLLMDTQDVTWHSPAYGTGLVCHQPVAWQGGDRSCPQRLVRSRAVPAAHLPSASAITSAAELIDHRRRPEPRVAHSLFRRLSAADSRALCPPLFLVLQSFNLCEKPAWLHIPESCCITPLFSPLICFSRTVFFLPWLSHHFSSSPTPPAGGAALFFNVSFFLTACW